MKKTDDVVIAGHRGAHGLAPDNTFAGYRRALEYGVDIIEVDLRLSRDGEIVMLHDGKLRDAAGNKLRVADTTYRQLRAHKPGLTTLRQTVGYVNRRCRMMLEIKDPAVTAPTIAALRRYLSEGWQPADFMIASFDFKPLADVHKALPDIEIVVLQSWLSVRAAHRARRLDTPYLSMDQRFLWWGAVWLISRRFRLFCYPYRKLLHIKHRKPALWVKYGLYGIITDYPDYFRPKSSGIIEPDEGYFQEVRRAYQPD